MTGGLLLGSGLDAPFAERERRCARAHSESLVPPPTIASRGSRLPTACASQRNTTSRELLQKGATRA